MKVQGILDFKGELPPKLRIHMYNMLRVDVFFFFFVEFWDGKQKVLVWKFSCEIALSAAIHAHFVAMPFATQLQTCPAVCFS